MNDVALALLLILRAPPSLVFSPSALICPYGGAALCNCIARVPCRQHSSGCQRGFSADGTVRVCAVPVHQLSLALLFVVCSLLEVCLLPYDIPLDTLTSYSSVRCLGLL